MKKSHNGFVTLTKPYEKSCIWGWGLTIEEARRAANLTYDQEQKQGSITTRWFGDSNPSTDTPFEFTKDYMGFGMATQKGAYRKLD